MEDEELLSVLLGTRGPLARQLLERFGDLAGVLGADAVQLLTVKGIGPTKAAILLAARELAIRLPRAGHLPVIGGTQQAHRIFASLAFESQEVVAAAFLDARNRLLRQREIFRGTVQGADARPREILREALRVNATKLVVAHNHPSGSCEPSEEDGRFTARLEFAAREVGLQLVDHLIIGAGNAYFSFASAGLILAA